MKKITTLIVASLAMFLVACGDSPKNVAQSFTESLANGEITEAKKYTTEQTGKFLDAMASAGHIGADPDFEFVFIEEKIDDNRATVKFKESGKEKEEKIDLVKIDGEWKVEMTK